MNYRIFDLVIDSELPLTVLPEVEPGPSSLSIRRGKFPDSDEFHLIHEWGSAEGEVFIACKRRGQRYQLLFPDLCGFTLQPEEGLIEVYPLADDGLQSAEHLLVDQVIPRLLGHRGRVITHASGVVMADGRALAFLGQSGFGKSTLASSFYQAGAAILADDCLELVIRDDQLMALSPYASFRLWPDTAKTLFGPEAEFHQYVTYTSKRQLLPAQPQRIASGPVPVAALFLLENSSLPGPEGEVRISPSRGMLAATAMLEAAFILDVRDRQTLTRSFDGVMRILQSGTPVFHLNHPRNYAQLDRVRAAIQAMV